MNETLWLVMVAIGWDQVDTGASGVKLTADRGHVGFCPLFESEEAALRFFPRSRPIPVEVPAGWPRSATTTWPIAGEA